MVTKLRNEIANFRQCLDESLFEAWERYKLSIDRCLNHNMFPVTQIDTFYNGLTLRHRDTINAAAGGTFMKRRPKECYDLIENMTAHQNDLDTSSQRSESSSSITSSFDTKIAALKAEMAEINKNLMRVLQPPLAILKTYMLQEPIKGANQGQNQPLAYQAPAYQALVHQSQISQPQVVTANEFTNFMKANDAILKNMQTNMTSLTNSNLELKNKFGQFMKMNTASSSGSGTLPGLTIPTTSSSPVVKRKTEATKDTVHPTNNRSTEDVQPSVFPTESPILNSKPVISPIIEPVASSVSAPRPNQRPKIPYPSRLQDQKPCDKANDQREKIFQIFKDLNFNISFADAFILMPKFGPSIKSLLTNKDKLCELARTPLNEHCSAVLLKKLPEKLEDPGNHLPDLSPTCMTLELTDRLISRPVGVAEDVFVKVEAFLNDDPSLPPPNQENYLPEVRKELKICEAKYDKSSIDEPPEVDLKDLPPHLEYAFLEGDDKLPVIIAKDLSMEEKTALITVLKSHKRASAWKLSDIKGIDPEFCTHKILWKRTSNQRFNIREE
nr:reverse transcriptase domain-containing protein [Tanacetum cinerariifolium]GEZ71038.1 reverse transcriptase domain-containing protein [Tanacetum cinerariifolium]